MNYIGIDLHRDNFHAVVMDENGESLHSQKYVNCQEAVNHLLTHCEDSPQVVMEATRNWMWLTEALQKKGCEVSLAHPLKLKAIATARIKTDSIDATILAHLLRTDMIPKSYIPSLQEQDHREISRARGGLVKQRTLVKNQIHSLLAKENLKFDGTDLFGKAGQEWLEEVQLRDSRQAVLQEYLLLLDNLQKRIDSIDQLIKQLAKDHREIEILMSVPGIGLNTAFLLNAEIGDITRFSSGKKLASYLGMVPSLYQSGSTYRHGRITKQGNPQVRWSLVQAAWRIIRADKGMAKTYYRISDQSGKKKAIVAIARKIAVLCWRLLVDNRVYEPKPPKRGDTEILPGH